jgi:integrase
MGRTGDGVEVRANSIRLRFTWEGQAQFPTLRLNGKALPPTAANIKYARRLAVEIKRKITDGVFSMAEYFPASGDTAGLTVAAQLDTWLAAQRIEASTRDSYSSGVRFWKAAIGHLHLRVLKPSAIKIAMAARADLTGKTLNNYIGALRGALALALDDGLLQVNPAADIEAATHQKAPPDPLTQDEAEKVIAAMPSGQVQNLVEFWMWTGLRTSEIAGLKWANVDLASGAILVAEARVRGVHKNNTKTNVARTIKLNSRALAALQRQRQHTFLADGEVFQDPRYGTPWGDERAFRRSYWTPVLKRLGIRYRRPYAMRHTYATIMLMAGMNHAFCARVLGHSVNLFQQTYSRWIDGEQNDREMDRLESSILPKLLPSQLDGSGK